MDLHARHLEEFERYPVRAPQDFPAIREFLSNNGIEIRYREETDDYLFICRHTGQYTTLTGPFDQPDAILPILQESLKLNE